MITVLPVVLHFLSQNISSQYQVHESQIVKSDKIFEITLKQWNIIKWVCLKALVRRSLVGTLRKSVQD